MNNKSSTTASAAAAVAATAATTSSLTPTTSTSTHQHAAEAAALVGEHVPEGEVTAGGAALNSAASSFRRARSRSSAGALAGALSGLSLLDGTPSSSDGGMAASSTSRPSTPTPFLAAEGGEEGGEGAAVGGASPKQTNPALSPPRPPSRSGATAAAAAAAKVQRPFSKLGAAAAALVARYVACPTRAAASLERFASAARLVLHFDVNKTIVMTDGAQGAGAGCVVNMMLSECAWGRLEPGAEPTPAPAAKKKKSSESESESQGRGGGTASSAAAATADAKEEEAKEEEDSDSVPPLPAPQVRWVAVGRLAADRPLADPQLMTYRSFLDSFALPSDVSMAEHDRERRRRARQDLKRRFTDVGQPGAMFSSVHAAVVDELSRAQAAACRDNNNDDENKKCVEKCVHGHHLLRPTVLPSFFNLLLHLQAQRRRFTLVLRSFGTDLPAVIDEINAFAEGRHPSYPGARLDGSDGRVDVRISEAKGHLGAFVRLTSRPDGTSLLLGAPRELIAAREYGPRELLAAAKATKGARHLRTFGDIHAAIAGPPPWRNSLGGGDAGKGPSSASQNDSIVSRALALRDYYPFWKASGERGRAGKLFLLDDGESADGDVGGAGNNDASTPPLSPSPPRPAVAASSTGGEVLSAAAAAAANAAAANAAAAPPKRDPSQVVHVFFDDNVGHGAANIVDARNAKTGAGIPFADVARAHLVRVEPLGAVLDPAFFVRAVHEAVLAASSVSSSSSSSSAAATANAAAACSSSDGNGAPHSDALLLSPRPLRKLSSAVSMMEETVPAAAAALASKSSSREEGNNGGGNASAAAAAAPPSPSSAAAAANAPAATATEAPAAALPGEYCHKCGKVHPLKAGAGGGGVAGAAASEATAAENNKTGGGGGGGGHHASHHASARGKALWFLARARLMTVVRLGVAARLGGAVHETLEGSLTASVGRGDSGSVSGGGGGRSRSRGSSGLAQLLSEGKTIGEALAEKAEKEQQRRS